MSQSQAPGGKSVMKRKEAPDMQHHASKDTRKRAASKREDEVSSHRMRRAQSHTVQIPKFVKPNAASDTSTDSKRRREAKEKKALASSKSHPKKRTSHTLVCVSSFSKCH